MAQDYPNAWWFLSFLAVGVAQQPMLIGISLPAYSVHRNDTPLGVWDGAALLLCVSGLSLAYVADTQLYHYMKENETRGERGESKLMVLDTGVWRYSRHPNYVGETTWWLGFGVFAVAVGEWYMLGGWVLNTGVLLHVTALTEERMRANRSGERLEAFRAYQEATPCWVPTPWPAGKGSNTRGRNKAVTGGDEASKPMLNKNGA